MKYLSLILLFAPTVVCAQTTISQLPAASAITGVEVAPVVQNTVTVKASMAQIDTYIAGKTHTWSAAQTFSAAPTFSVAPVFTDQAGTRSALSLGSAATKNTGTSGATVPLLNAGNTFSGNNTFSATNTFSGTTSFSGPITYSGLQTFSNGAVGTSSGPAWASYNTIFDANKFDINSFPTNNEFGGNTVGIAQAFVGSINIPSSSLAANHGAGLAGYAMSSSTHQGAVGSFGFGGMAAAGVSAWGGNDLVQNCPIAAACATNSGYNSGVLYGREIDINLYKSGGVASTDAVRGLYIIGGSEAASSNPTFYGIDIDSPGISLSPHAKWAAAYVVEDGAATAGIQIGTTGTGNNVGSQTILFGARDSGGSTHTSSIQSDPAGDLVLTAATGAAAVLSSQSACQLSAQPTFNGSTCAIRPPSLTLAQLNASDTSPQAGDHAMVNDATAGSCVANTVVVGGSSVTCAVVYSGTAWKALVTH